MTGHNTICSYVHQSRIGVLVAVSTTTDFAAKTEDFRSFCKHLCLQIVSMNPDTVEDLLAQEWAVDDLGTTADVVAAISKLLGEPVSIVRFIRMEAGVE